MPIRKDILESGNLFCSLESKYETNKNISGSNIQKLKLNIFGNLGERPHECPECHRKFSSTSNLKTHRRLHTGDKPFPCDLCTCRFTQYVHLKLHIRLHRNERPFNCRCGKAYISSSGLRTHWKTTASCSPTQEDLENMNKTAEYLAVVEKEMQLNTEGGIAISKSHNLL